MAVKAQVRRIQAELKSGQRITVPTWRLNSGKPGPTFLLTAAQHGNEVQGSEAIRRFVEAAPSRLRAGKIIAVPFVNLPAIRDRRPHIRMGPEQPYGDDRGHNMNRTWPGKRSGNATAQLSRAIYQAVGDQATHVLDLHCWQKYSAPAVLIRDVPGIREIAAKLGHRFVQVNPAGNKITITGYFCSTGRVGITYECAGQYLVDEHQVQRCLRVVNNFAKVIGVIRGRPEKGDDPVLFSDETQSTEVRAPVTGLFVARDYQLCDPVRKGALLGHILSDVDLKRHDIVSPETGYLRAYNASRANCDVALPAQHPYVSKGDRLATVACKR